jgi:hypothetical protein
MKQQRYDVYSNQPPEDASFKTYQGSLSEALGDRPVTVSGPESTTQHINVQVIHGMAHVITRPEVQVEVDALPPAGHIANLLNQPKK